MYQIKSLVEAPRNVKRLLMLASDLTLIPISISVAILVQNDFRAFSLDLGLLLLMLLTSITSSFLFMKMGLYLAAVRFMGHEALFALIKGVTLSTLIFTLFSLLLDSSSITSISVHIIYWGVAFVLIGVPGLRS